MPAWQASRGHDGGAEMIRQHECHHRVTRFGDNCSMSYVPAAKPPGGSSWAALELAGDEAVLPAGSRLADEASSGRQCFVILEGTAAVEAAGQQLGDLSTGAFVGSVDCAGGPLPPAGLTVRLTTSARVLVLDAARLGALIESDPAAAAAWHGLARRR